MGNDIQSDLEKLQEANEFYEDGMSLISYADNFRGNKKYAYAYNQFKEAKEKFKSLEAKLACLKAMNHCKKRKLGILDLRHLGCGIYFGETKITEAQMNEILKVGNYQSASGGSKRRRSSVSVKDVINQLLKDKGGPDKVKYEEALEEAQKADPQTKFNPMHWSYYKSMWKKQQRKEAAK